MYGHRAVAPEARRNHLGTLASPLFNGQYGADDAGGVSADKRSQAKEVFGNVWRSLRSTAMSPRKVGDEVTVVLHENKLVSEIHPKASKRPHRYMDGQIDLMSARWRKWLSCKRLQGEQVFPLEKVNTEPIEEGATVTVELNEAGSVISLHRADSAAPKH